MPRVLSFTTSGLTFEVDRAQGGLRCTQVLRPHLLHRKPHARVLLVGGVHNTSHASVFSECQACDGSAVVGHTATPAQKARACFLHQHVCAVCSLPTRYPNVDTARPRNKGQVMHGRITGRQCCNELSIKKASGYIHMYIYICVCVFMVFDMRVQTYTASAAKRRWRACRSPELDDMLCRTICCVYPTLLIGELSEASREASIPCKAAGKYMDLTTRTLP